MFYEIYKEERDIVANQMDIQSDIAIDVETSKGNRVKIPLDTNGNILVNGTTRYGKTVFIKNVAKEIIYADPEALIVFFDVKDDYISEFYEPENKVMSYYKSNEYDNPFIINIMKEIRQSKDPEADIREITSLLWQDIKAESKEGYFSNASQEAFMGFLRTILYTYDDCPSNEVIINSLKNMTFKDLIIHLRRWPGNEYIVRDHLTYDGEYKMSRQSQGVMGFLSQVIPIFGGLFCTDGEDTIDDFMCGKYGNKLFLEYDYSRQASSNVFFRFVLKKIIQNKLSMNTDRTRKVYLILDEIAVLNGDFSLMDALTIGAGNNLDIILGTQSIEKLYCVAPKENAEHITNASLAGCASIVSFHPGDPNTIETIQKLFGEENRQILSLGFSRYEPPNMVIQKEFLVSFQELSSLGVGECFIKTKNQRPYKVKIIA